MPATYAVLYNGPLTAVACDTTEPLRQARKTNGSASGGVQTRHDVVQTRHDVVVALGPFKSRISAKLIIGRLQ